MNVLEQFSSRQPTPSRQTPKLHDKHRKLSIPSTDTSAKSHRPDSHEDDKESIKSKKSAPNKTDTIKIYVAENLDNATEQSKSASLSKSGKSKSERNSNRTEMVKSEGENGQAQSGNSSDRSLSPKFLEPPGPDVRLEQLVLPNEEAMVDLRKRDRDGLKGYNSKVSTAIVGTFIVC